MRRTLVLLVPFLVAGCTTWEPQDDMDPDCADVVQPLQTTGLIQGDQETVVARLAAAFDVAAPTERGETTSDGGAERTIWDHPDGHVYVHSEGSHIRSVSFMLRGARFDDTDQIAQHIEATAARLGIDDEGFQVTTHQDESRIMASYVRSQGEHRIDTVLSSSVAEPSIVFGSAPMTRYDARPLYDWPCDAYPLDSAERVAKDEGEAYLERAGLPGPLTLDHASFSFRNGILEIVVTFAYGDPDTCDPAEGGRLWVHLDGFTSTFRSATHRSVCEA